MKNSFMFQILGILFLLVSCSPEGTPSTENDEGPTTEQERDPSDTQNETQSGHDADTTLDSESETLHGSDSTSGQGSDTTHEGTDDEPTNTETSDSSDDFPVSGWKVALVGGFHSCALDENQKLHCWGANFYGEAGNGKWDEELYFPQAIGDKIWKQIAPGNDYTCGITLEDDLFCWGRSYWGQTGTSQIYTNDGVHVPTPVDEGSKWKHIATGSEHSCGIKTDGTLWCWGNNYSSQLGIGEFGSPQSIPVKVDTEITDWKHVDVAYQYSCALTTGDELYCFGFLEDEKLQTKHLKKSPQHYFEDTRWKTIALGGVYRCGIQQDDGLYCFGTNGHAQLGNGTRTEQYTTVQRIGTDTWKQIAAGDSHTCGVTLAGELYCWGYQQGGRLGNGKNVKEYALTPQKVGNQTNWLSASVGQWHTCALNSDGEIYCFGTNEYGQVGNGKSNEMTTTPALIQ
jgi:alpha-tubulin suppressor-like RCC1 family protein